MGRKARGYKYFTGENKKEFDAMTENELIRTLIANGNEIKEQKKAMKLDEDLQNLQLQVKEVKAGYKKIIEEKQEHSDYILKLLDARKNGKEMPTA